MPKVLSVFLVVLFLAVEAPAVEYSFTHFAGTTGGGGYQDGVGSAARFYRPMAMAMDRNGYVYVGDNNTIRRISPTGNVTTFAGKWRDIAYVNGDAGVARMTSVVGIVVDSAGNLFFPDLCTVRKITPAGVVSTFAGTPGACTVIDAVGASARFNFPQGIAIDSADNLYVSESSHTIRKILPDGTVSTLAGTPFSPGSTDATGSAARFNFPAGLVVDSGGNVIVADRNNQTIRRITPAGVVSTLAGLALSSAYLDGTGSAARFSAPLGLTIDSSDNVFVVELSRHSIRQVSPGGVVTTHVGSALSAGAVDGNGVNARFRSPRGIISDRRGGFFVADTFNNTVRRVSATLDVTTLAGALPERALVNDTGTNARFGFPRDVTTDAAGNLYVTDNTFDVIRKITPAGVVTSFTGGNGHGGTDGPSGIAQFAGIIGIASDSSGNLYVADIEGRTVRKVTPGGDVSTLAGSFGNQGYIDATGSSARLHSPHSVAVDASGNVYVTEFDAHTIRKITPAGVVTTLAGQQGVCGSTDATGTLASFCNPRGITIGSGGHLFVADFSNQKIRRIDPASGVVTTFAGSGSFGTLDGNGVAANFASPMELAADASGNLFVTEGSNFVRMIDLAANVTTISGGNSDESIDGTGGDARIFNPDGVAIAPSGHMYITGLDDAAIYVVREAIADAGTFTAPAIVGSVVQLDTAPSTATAWTWTLVRRPAGSEAQLSSTTIRNPTFTPDLPDLYTFLVRAESATGVRFSYVDVLPTGACVLPLTGVSISSSGVLTFCGSADGGTVSVSGTTGDGLELAYRWGYRTVPGGAITDIPGANGTSYVLHGPDFGGSGVRYVVATAVPACGPEIVSNEVAVNVQPAPVTIITADALVQGLSSGNVASVPDAGPGATYSWTIAGGVITSGAGTRTITYSARNSSPLSLSITATLSGCTSNGSKTIAVAELPYTFERFVGTTGGAAAVDGEGTAARFRQVNGVGVSASGTIYVSDANGTIRMISPSGRVSTLAGLAESLGTVNATGVGARTNGAIQGLAVDASGNVFFADYSSRLIRKITPAGVVTTFAGSGADGSTDGLGTAASFRGPHSLAFDAAGNLYVTDQLAHTIRKITPAGSVTTLAGADNQLGYVDASGSAARFAGPCGIGVDASGNVYVADSGNYRIRRITPAGDVTTYAGAESGTLDGPVAAARFSSPFGLAVDAQGNVYVSEVDAHRIRRITPAGQVSTVAGLLFTPGYQDGTGASARFANPYLIAAAPGGDLIVPDRSNFKIRRVTSAGVVTTVAGAAAEAGTVDGTGAAARLNDPFGMAFAADGSIYFSDSGNHVIRRVTTAGVVTTIAGAPGVGGASNGTGTAARFNRPGGLVVDSAGNIFVADRGNEAIRRVTPAGVVTTVAGALGATGSANGTGSGARFNEPTGIVLDSAGNFLISDRDNHTIRKMTPAFVVTTLAGQPGVQGSVDATGSAARFRFPVGLAIDSSDNLFVADLNNNDIRKVTPAGEVTTVVANPPGLGTVTSVAVDSGGDLFFGSSTVGIDDTLLKKPALWPAVSVIGGNGAWPGALDGTATNARLRGVNSILIDSNGTLYIAEGPNHSIRRAHPTPLPDLATGPTSVAAGSPAALDVTPQTATSYSWSILRRPGGSAATFSDPTLRNPTFVPDMPDRYRLLVRASNVAGVRFSTIDIDATGSCSPALSGVTASLMGSASFCASGTGGTATAVVSGGADVAYRWGWRSTPGGAINDIPGANTASYLIRGTDLGGTGTKYLVVTAVPSCGTPMVSNEIVLSVLTSPDATITSSGPVGGGSPGNIASVPNAGFGASYVWSISHGTITAGAGTRAITYTAGNDDYVRLEVTVTAGGCPRTSTANVAVTPRPYTWEVLAGTTGGIGFYDGQGTSSRFFHPVGMVVDRNGNTYVSDATNTVRRISPTGQVSTLAGLANAPCVPAGGMIDGTRSAARFCTPDGLTVDNDGNVYVADTYHQSIRKITPDGVVTTLAGNGNAGSADGTGAAATFANPYGITWVESENVLYVCEAWANTVRRVTMGGVVTTVAGAPFSGGMIDATGAAARFNTPYDITNDGTYLYVADWNNHRLRRIDLSTFAVTTLAGSTFGYADGPGATAQFRYPHAVEMDPDGNIIIADSYYGHTIRRVTPAGVVSTVAGVPGVPGSLDGPVATAMFDVTADLAVDAAGGILTGDYTRHNVRKITTAGMVVPVAGLTHAIGSADGTGTAATFDFAYGVGIDAAGNLYVPDTYNHTIRKVTPAGVVTTFAGTPDVPGTADGTGADARFFQPRSAAVDSAGNVFVTDWVNRTIRKITPAGQVSTFAGIAGVLGTADGGPGVATFREPIGIAIDSADNVYVSDYAAGTIRKITPAGIVSTLAGTAFVPGFADGSGPAARFNGPHALAVGPGDVLYLADANNHRVRKITPSGDVSTLAGVGPGYVDGPASSARFNIPTGVDVDPFGVVYVADQANHRIRKVMPDGTVSTIGGQTLRGNTGGTAGNAMIGSPAEVVIDASGKVYLVDVSNNTIHVGRPTPLNDVATAPGAVTTGSVVVLDTTPETGGTTYQWSVVRRPAGSASQLNSTTAANPQFVPDIADVYTFVLRAQQGSNVRYSHVSFTATGACVSPLSSVTASLDGPATVCATGTGPTSASAAATGGAALSYRWGYRTVPGGATTDIPAANGPSYLINGNDLGGTAGTRYLVVTVTPGCGAPMTSSEIEITLTPALSSVSIGVTGSTNPTPKTTAGTATLTYAGGTAVTRQWGYRTAPGGAITNIPGQTATTYLITGSHFPAVGYYYLVATATPTCGVVTTSNEIPITVGATVPTDVDGEPNAAGNSINVTWSPAIGGGTYEVLRSTGGGVFTVRGTTAGTAFVDPSSPNTFYLYRIRVVGGGESANALVGTYAFTDPSLTGVTIKAVHFTELRNAANALRAWAGVAPAVFTDPSLSTAITVKRVHLVEIRDAINQARVALTVAPVLFTDPTVTVGVTPVKASHITELRNGIR